MCNHFQCVFSIVNTSTDSRSGENCQLKQSTRGRLTSTVNIGWIRIASGCMHDSEDLSELCNAWYKSSRYKNIFISCYKSRWQAQMWHCCVTGCQLPVSFQQLTLALNLFLANNYCLCYTRQKLQKKKKERNFFKIPAHILDTFLYTWRWSTLDVIKQYC